MKTAVNSRGRGQVYSVGNYLMTGKNLGKGHFARVEEATHRVIGKKVAIKIIDLTCIKEEYARRNLHREPRVMARLRHPCIAALYETMMHGPRLYVVMEAACGGDLCAHVLCARGATRGLPEARARPLAAQLVSAVRHMHAQGVVHRDLKMENIMLDSTKQLIKIVDFGLSNTWCAGGSLRTPCGSLEYAAPELFVDGRRYGPEVDLWSIGVIVYGMVTGGLPFTSGEGAGRGGGGGGGGGGAGGAGGAGAGGAGSRPLLRAAIARGFTRKQRTALACVSDECKTFVERLLEPQVDLRMKIEDASRHRWLRRMRPPPLHPIDPKDAREIYREISEICGQPVMEVVAQIKGEPYGAAAGMYNIKAHSLQLRAVALDNTTANKVTSVASSTNIPLEKRVLRAVTGASSMGTIGANGISGSKGTGIIGNSATSGTATNGNSGTISRAVGTYANGDCARSRLPIIDEHSNDFDTNKKRIPFVRRVNLDCERRLYSCPERGGDSKRHSTGSDNVTNWRLGMKTPPAARILLQSNATTIKRASLGNIVSPHSSSNSHCKSERAMPVGWLNRTSAAPRDAARPRRAAIIK